MSIKAHFLQDKNKEKFYPYGHASAVYDKNGNTVQECLDDMETSITEISSNVNRLSVQVDWDESDTSSMAYLKNKPLSMPASDVHPWAKATTKPDYSWNEIENKPSTYVPSSHEHDNATQSNDGFLSASDKIKIDNIEENANHYIHPEYQENQSGLYKVTIDALGHVSQSTPVTKDDITALGIPASDTNTTYSNMTGASSSAAGKSGLVPAPDMGDHNKFLRGDGTWSDSDAFTGTLPIEKGGTAASTTLQARVNLGATNILSAPSEPEPSSQENGDVWLREI